MGCMGKSLGKYLTLEAQCCHSKMLLNIVFDELEPPYRRNHFVTCWRCGEEPRAEANDRYKMQAIGITALDQYYVMFTLM